MANIILTIFWSRRQQCGRRHLQQLTFKPVMTACMITWLLHTVNISYTIKNIH